MSKKDNLVSVVTERNNIISIVTASYNQGQFIADTIESVIFQRGNFYVDYIIMDGGSTDSTVDIIKAYENHLKSNCTTKTMGDKNYYVSKNDYNANASEGDIWVKNPLNVSCRGVSFTWESKKDKGQYDAIRQGFEKASGSVFAYINSDDMYLSNSFKIVLDIFLHNSFVHWIKGYNGYFNESGDFMSERINFSNYVLRKGYYDGLHANLPCLQQESTFWTKDLYERAGRISTEFQYAGDYALWLSFAKLENLYMVPYALGGFRFQKNQKTHNITPYNEEVNKLVKRSEFQRILCTVLHKSRNSRTLEYMFWPFSRFVAGPFRHLLCRGGKTAQPSVPHQKIF